MGKWKKLWEQPWIRSCLIIWILGAPLHEKMQYPEINLQRVCIVNEIIIYLCAWSGLVVKDRLVWDQ